MKSVRRGVVAIAVVTGVIASSVGQVFVRPVSAAPTGLPAGFTATTLQNFGLGAPTSVRIAPDGRVFVIDLMGSIKLFTPGSGLSAVPFGSVSVDATGDRGLLGAAFDPVFATNPYLYIHYVGTDDKVRIARYNASGNVGTDFQVLYTAPTASGFQHAGGGITVGNDGYVYFGIGDSGTPTNGQDMTTVNGKIHRIKRDGSIPVNPFAGQQNVPATIYDYGVRNPFRMQTDRQTGAIYVGDVGYNTWEEVNLITAGKNYGWPTQEGPCTSACPYENPVYWYQHQFGTNNTNDASIVLGPVYRGGVYPASYQGKMFVSDYVQGFLRTINPVVTSNAYTTLATGNGPVVDMDVGPDGKLYFVTISGATLYRLDYTGGAVNQPPIAAASANKTSGPAPLTVNFSSAGSSDPEGAALSYNWNFGDGTTSTQQNPSKVYNANGKYTVQLTVSDGANSTPAQAFTVQVGSQPIVTFSAPNPAVQFVGNDVITYSATATESNGTPIANNKLQATVTLYHSDHTHPFMGPIAGGSGSFTIPTNGELSPEIWYRITVEATGATGVTGSAYVEVHPKTATLTVNTNPAGLNVMLDGSNHVIPPTVEGVVGLSRSVSAPSPQLFNGKEYVFDHWSDGGAQTHTFSFPANTTTLTAYYVESTAATNFQNIVDNPSFETLDSGGKPVNWTFNKWGTNDAAWQSSNDAIDGQRSVVLSMTSAQSGEGTLLHPPVAVSPSTTHSVRYRYKSTVQVKSVADITLTDGTHQYIWLGITQPSAAWNEQNWTFVTPANAAKAVVTTKLDSPGSLTIDDFGLLAPSSSAPAVTAPSVQLAAAPAAITAGQATTLSWSVAGSAASCTSSGGWSGPVASGGSQVVAPSATTTYTISCTNSAGTDTKSVTVTVLPIAPVSNNVLANPSFEDEDDAMHLPLSWQSARWGTNSGVLETVHGNAYDGDHYAHAAITAHTSGESGWKTAAQPITPSAAYTFSQYFKATGPTKVLAEIQLSTGQKQYLWLGALPQTTAWQKFTKDVTMPANAQSVVIGTYLTGVGDLSTDLVSLVTAGNPGITPPNVTLSASSTTISAGQPVTLMWNATGTAPTCTASGGWSGGQAVSGSLSVAPTVTTTYTLLCSNMAGIGTKSVTVTVESAPATNLIANPSLIDGPQGATVPAGWYVGKYGTNTVNFAWQTTGRTDSRSLATTASSYVNGDAKWFFEPVAVVPGQLYHYSYWYKSDASSEVLIGYVMADGTRTYDWRGVVSPVPSWTQGSFDLTPPTGASYVTVYHVSKSNGTLQLDDFSLNQ